MLEDLKRLEYAIRQSIPVREDQEDPADTQQLQEARRCGIDIRGELSKGDLLSLVQTRLRSLG